MKSILHPVARPTGSTGRKTRRVSNKKFNGPLKVALKPILEPVLSGTRRGGIFRDRLSKAATFLPFFTHAFKSVSVREMLSLHATLFEYSGEILATYSVTGARASPFRLFHRILSLRDPGFRLSATLCPMYITYIRVYLVQSCARGQGRSLIVLL